MSKKSQSELLEQLNITAKDLNKLEADDIHLVKEEDYDAKARNVKFVPLNKKGAMSKDAFVNAQRRTIVSEKAQIRLRMANQPSSGIEYIDLCYYDKNKQEYVGMNKIPLFYRKLYSHAYGKEQFVFYCHYKNVDRIIEMLKADKSVLLKHKQKINEKKKQIEDALKESLKGFDDIED